MMNKPTLIMLQGLPGSGKSQLALAYEKAGFIVFSSDTIRKELFGDSTCQTDHYKVFDELHKRVKNALVQGQDVVYDACNLSSKKRRHFLSMLVKIPCSKEIIVLATPVNTCVERDIKRTRTVGGETIGRMMLSWQMPNYFEGWDKIGIKMGMYDIEVYSHIWTLSFHIPQHNSHHTLTIGDHNSKVRKYLYKHTDDHVLQYAGYHHDIGKVLTKSFYNYKGVFSAEAHYYGHESVSAYMAMFLLTSFSQDELIECCNLIQYHMRPHLLKTEKSINKFKKLVGNEFYDKLLILHQADKEAR